VHVNERGEDGMCAALSFIAWSMYAGAVRITNSADAPACRAVQRIASCIDGVLADCKQ
jgi:hypothetical protein